MRGVAEHHALVARALVLGILADHAARDVGTLLVDGVQNAAAVRVELVFCFRVADAADGVAHDGLQVDISRRAYFAGHDDLSRGDECFAGHPGLRVLEKQVVEDCVGDLVGYLVGVSLRHGFRSK